MADTRFPVTPSDVEALTATEFATGFDVDGAGVFDRVCGSFADDANRAVVWLIRFRALTAWRDREDVSSWLDSDASLERHACAVAASFRLNEDWEFQADTFRAAVESMTRPDSQGQQRDEA